jgi:hypothetical protein
MPLTIEINTRSNQLQVEDGRSVVTTFEFTPGEDVVFKYSGRELETVSCLSQVGTLAPTTLVGRAGRLEHPTSATVELYTLDLSGTVKAGAQPSNVTFTLKKKSSGSGAKGPKGQPPPTE